MDNTNRSSRIVCMQCDAPYEQRENLLTHKMLWFPTCKHQTPRVVADA